jgi:murein DD-endopeptidase MepM/ murein hydrolase activator NlpD
MTRPRINIMIMTEGETTSPVRSYSVPWYAARAAIAIGAVALLLLIVTSSLAVYFYSASREVDELRTQMKSMGAAMEKLEALQRELVYHREFTRRVAGLLGISVPDFEDSAYASMRTGLSGMALSDSTGNAGSGGESEGFGGVGVLVTDFPPDPNNRPRCLPLAGSISRGFAPHQSNPSLRHSGIDLAAREGTPVLATADGTVEFAAEDDIYGLLIVVDHGNGFKTTYGHNSLILVKANDTVHRGDRIAFSGNTGISTAPHLHYEIEENGTPVDPSGFLGK